MHWDKVIKAKNNLFDLKLKDVWKYRDLLFLFVKRDFIAFYKQTVLGPIWFFVQPLFTVVMYVFLFGKLANISTDSIPQPLFYLVGIISWSYFSDCLLKTSTVFKDNASIFGKVYFPRLIMPLSIVISNLIRLAIQSILLLIIIIYYNYNGYPVELTFKVFLVPILVLLMALQSLGLGMIVSALTTKYRDLALLVSFSVQLLMYTTTVVYPLNSVHGKMRSLVYLNPLTSVIEGLRFSILGQGSITFESFYISLLTTLLIVITGILIFNKVEKTFIDTI
jgi:lipopolysaccharide transport system permease protein